MKFTLEAAIRYVIENTRDKTQISSNIEKVKKLFAEKSDKCPNGLEYLKGEHRDQYIHDMQIAQKWAHINRVSIAKIILAEMRWRVTDRFDTVHNYLGDDNIIRKSAVSAQKGERLIIPLNMRDGSVIAIGKGNPDWNYSAPHGAGRSMSRKKAKAQINLKDFQDSMNGVWTSSVSDQTIDEAPMAYKDSESILEQIKDTCTVVKRLKPIYNFKASE